MTRRAQIAGCRRLSWRPVTDTGWRCRRSAPPMPPSSSGAISGQRPKRKWWRASSRRHRGCRDACTSSPPPGWKKTRRSGLPVPWRRPRPPEAPCLRCAQRFEKEDAAIFYGREALVAALVARLADTPLVAVTGPSGAGKSSVVRAGLLPALAAGVLPGSGRWRQHVLTPGTAPRARLPQLPEDARAQATVVVVDQFEELFTAYRDEAERASFAAGLRSE